MSFDKQCPFCRNYYTFAEVHLCEKQKEIDNKALKERRERIAAQILAGMVVTANANQKTYCAQQAVEWADALLKELDRE